MPTFTQDFPEFRDINTGNENVDRIRRTYASQDAERARAARRRMQEPVEHEHKPRATDARRNSWEEQRRIRNNRGRNDKNREVIDGRGSIDSRAFNERQELVGYTIDERDQHEPMLDTSETGAKWRSHDGYDVSRHRISMGSSYTPSRPSQIGIQGGRMGSRREYAAGRPSAGIPLFVKVMIPVIIVLVIILIVLLLP